MYFAKGAGLWGAFWMFSDGINDSSVSGADGTEIDIFESPYYSDYKNNKISANLHYGGYAQNHRQLVGKRCRVPGNPYDEFNTYGVEWNENGYIFYLNGKEWYRTDFGGKDNIAAVKIDIGINDRQTKLRRDILTKVRPQTHTVCQITRLISKRDPPPGASPHRHKIPQPYIFCII